jgi:hypothetical protein
MEERTAIVNARFAEFAVHNPARGNRDGMTIERLLTIQRLRASDACTDYKDTDRQY